MSDETYRGVNRYVNYSTGKEILKYTKTYNQPAKAKAQTTRWRNDTKWIGDLADAKPADHPDRQGGYLWHSRDMYYSTYEYEDTWVERAVEWERI